MEYLPMTKRVMHPSIRATSVNCSTVLETTLEDETVIVFINGFRLCCIPKNKYSEIIDSPNLKIAELFVLQVFGLGDFIGVVGMLGCVTVVRLDSTGFNHVTTWEFKGNYLKTSFVSLQNGLAMFDHISNTVTTLTYEDGEFIVSPSTDIPYYEQYTVIRDTTFSIEAIHDGRVVLICGSRIVSVSIEELEHIQSGIVTDVEIHNNVVSVINVRPQTSLWFSD